MLKDLLRKRLLAFIVTAIGSVLIHVFQDKLGLDAATAGELVDKIVLALMTYIGGQTATDIMSIRSNVKGSKVS